MPARAFSSSIAEAIVTASTRSEAHKPITSPFTFSDDVLPIVKERCAECHSPGGVGPMSLLTHADAVPWGESIRVELMAGHMPPWGVDSAASRFRNLQQFPAREMNVLMTWASGGTPPGKPDEAAAAYREAVRVNPNLAPAHDNLGVMLAERGSADEAVAAYRRAIEVNPGAARPYYNLGNALAARGDWDGALAAFRKALELQPDFAEAHCNLGHALRELGRLGEAVKALERGHALGVKVKGWRYPSDRWVLRIHQHFVKKRVDFGAKRGNRLECGKIVVRCAILFDYAADRNELLI